LLRARNEHAAITHKSCSRRTHVAKHFGGVKALHDVSLTIRRGEIYGLIGPNGAGKTTFFNCLTGLYKNESGHFIFDGVKLDRRRPAQGRGGWVSRGPFRTFACSAT
jgi:branched-chain amino acid transport system ATP-binding protein